MIPNYIAWFLLHGKLIEVETHSAAEMVIQTWYWEQRGAVKVGRE